MTPLRRKMIEEFQIRHYAPGTQKSYLHVSPVSRRPSVNQLVQKRKSGQQVGDWPQRRISLEVTGQLLQEGLPWPVVGFLVEWSVRRALRKVNLVAGSGEASTEAATAVMAEGALAASNWHGGAHVAIQSWFAPTTTCGEHPPAAKRHDPGDPDARLAAMRQLSGSFEGLERDPLPHRQAARSVPTH